MKTRILAFAEPFVDFWLSAGLQSDPAQFRQAKRLVVLSLAFEVWVTLFSILLVALGSVLCGAITFWTTLPIFGGLIALKCGRSPRCCGNTVTLGGWLTLTGLAILTGGLTGPTLLWYTVLPVVGVLTAGVLSGLMWTAICLASLIGFAIAQSLGVPFPQELTADNLALFRFAAVLGLVVCQFVMAAVRVAIEQHAISALNESRHELAKTRRLLSRLEESRGYTAEEWQRLRREHAALTHFVRFKYGELERAAHVRDGALEDDSLDEELDDDLLDEQLLGKKVPATRSVSSSKRREPDLATIALEAILRPRS